MTQQIKTAWMSIPKIIYSRTCTHKFLPHFASAHSKSRPFYSLFVQTWVFLNIWMQYYILIFAMNMRGTRHDIHTFSKYRMNDLFPFSLRANSYSHNASFEWEMQLTDKFILNRSKPHNMNCSSSSCTRVVA